MKKFLFITYGGTKRKPEERTEKVMKQWNDWFGSIGDNLVDGPNPLAGSDGEVKAYVVTAKETKTIASDMWPATGHMIIKAADMDEALKIAKESPMIINDEENAAIRVYEIMSK
jgi:hypothetical protein